MQIGMNWIAVEWAKHDVVNYVFLFYCRSFRETPNGVFTKWSRTFVEFTEFSEFRESEKSLWYELGSV